MYGLSVGVAEIGDTLPRAVYALLSSLSAATVGIIAHAAVELSNKAISDQLTRGLVFLGGAAGMIHNALWYFPVLMAAAGCAAVVHDYRLVHRPLRKIKGAFMSLRRGDEHPSPGDHENAASATATELQLIPGPDSSAKGRRNVVDAAESGLGSRNRRAGSAEAIDGVDTHSAAESEPRVVPQEYSLNFSWKVGTAVIAAFFATFIVIMVVRGVVAERPILYNLFANLYLAGTIIFGGGPVVIPLLREYIVAEGWISPRDFLIGLAIAQSFLGPNFNLAVFLGGLAAANAGNSAVAGGIIAFVGIFAPGIVLVHGTMGVWGPLRSRPWVKAAVRGINAAAVGLIYTAVYRIYQIGYLDDGFQAGRSLADDPWWVVVTATAFVGGRYFGLAAPLAILLGAAMGLVRYGIVSA